VEGIIIRRISNLGFRPEIAVHHVGRDNLINMVGKGYGLTLVVSSILGVTYPRVRFIPIEPTEIITWSVVWPRNNANPALKRLLALCDTGAITSTTALEAQRPSWPLSHDDAVIRGGQWLLKNQPDRPRPID
jgi:hypothetical protein